MRLRTDGDNSTKLLFANKSAGLGQIWYQVAVRFVDDANRIHRQRGGSSGRLLLGTTSAMETFGSRSTSKATGGGTLVL